MAFSARDKAAVSGPALIPAGELAGRPPIPLNRPIIVAGSRNNCRIHLISRSVSKAHCLIVLTRHTVYVRDLCTREGTFVNNERINGEVDLVEGDILKIGRFEFIFATGGARLRPHREKQAPPAVVQSGDAPPVPLEGRVSLAGRRGACDIGFLDDSVSTAHAVFVAWEGRRYVRDLGSRTGTWVNDKQIHQQEIHPGDRIKIGNDELIYQVSEAGAGVEVVASPTESAVAKAIPAQELEDVPLSADDTLPPAEKPKVAAPSARPVREAAPVPWEAPEEGKTRPATPLPDSIDVGAPEEHLAGEQLPAEQLAEDQPAEDQVAGEPVVAGNAEIDAIDAEIAKAIAGGEGEDTLPRRGWHRHGEEPAETPQTPFDLAMEEVEAAIDAPAASVPALELGAASNEFPSTAAAESAPIEESIELPPIPIEATIDAAAVAEAPLDVEEPVASTVEAPQADDVPTASQVSPQIDEVVASAEPTPDSAQVLESIDDAAPATAAEATVDDPAHDLTDTLVSRELGALSGSQAGEPVVVEPAPQPSENIELTAPLVAEVPLDDDDHTIELTSPQVAAPLEPAAEAPVAKVALTAALPPEPVVESPDDHEIELHAAPPPALEVAQADTIELQHSEPVAPSEDDSHTGSRTGRAVPPVTLRDPPAAAPPPVEPIAPIATPPVAPEPDLAIPSAHLPELSHETLEDDDIAIPSAHLPPFREPQYEPDIAIPSAHLPPLRSANEADLGIPSIHIPAFAPAEPEVSEEQSLPEVDEEVEATINLPPAESIIEEPPSTAVTPDEATAIDESEIDALLNEPSPSPEPAELKIHDQVDLRRTDLVVDSLDTAHGLTLGPEKGASSDEVDAEDAAPDTVAAAANQPAETGIAPLPITPPPSPDDAAANQPLALDEVVPEIPLTVTSDESDQLPIDDKLPVTAIEPASDTAFALTVPPAKAPPGSLTLSEAPKDDSTATSRASVVTNLPGDVAAESTDITASPDAVVSSDATINLIDAPIESPRFEEAAVEPSAETAETVVEDGGKPAAPDLSTLAAESVRTVPVPQPKAADESRPLDAIEPVEALNLTPPPMPADAPPVEGDADAPPGKFAASRPRKPAVVRDDFKKRRRRAVAESPFAGASITPADPFMAPPGDPFAPPPDFGAIDSLPQSQLAESTGGVAADSSAAIPTLLDPRPLRDRRAADPNSPRPRTIQQIAPAFAPTIPVATTVNAPPVEEPDLHELRRRRLKLIPTLLVASIMLMAGSVAAIWYLFPIYDDIETALKFNGFSAMTHVEQKVLQAEQTALLRQDLVRNYAVRELRKQHPELSSGFLGSTVAYDRVIMASGWSDNRPGEFVLRYRSSDDGDRARLHALATAMFDDERTRQRVRKSSDERMAIKRLEDDIDSNTRKLADLRSQLERERFLGEKRPKPGQMEELESAVLAAEKIWTDALAKLKHAQAEEARIDKLLAAARDNPPTAPENDEELARLNKEFTDLQAEYRALQSRQSEQATVARQEIDSAMDAFQQQIEEARGSGGESPELTQYIAAAENLQKTTRTLLDEMLDRQQTQYQRLSDLKLRLDEKAAARAAELRNADPQLRELTDEREVLRRQINAGIGADGAVDKQEIASKQQRLAFVENMIKSREEVLSSDPLYVEAITSLQTIIDQTQADIAADRKKADEKLDELQKSFAASSPAVSNLPEEQKQIALGVREQLASVASARQRYADVLEADRKANEEKLKEMQERIVTLQGDIDTRKRILSDEFVNKSVAALTSTLETQRKTLSATQQAEATARADFETKGRELRGMKDTVDALKNSDERMARLIADTEQTEGFLKSLNDQLEYKRSNTAAALLEIQPPAENEVKVFPGKDPRLLYILSALGAIVLLSAGSIWWTVHSANKIEFVPATPDFAPARNAPAPPAESDAAKQIDTNGNEEHPAVV